MYCMCIVKSMIFVDMNCSINVCICLYNNMMYTLVIVHVRHSIVCLVLTEIVPIWSLVWYIIIINGMVKVIYMDGMQRARQNV